MKKKVLPCRAYDFLINKDDLKDQQLVYTANLTFKMSPVLEKIVAVCLKTLALADNQTLNVYAVKNDYFNANPKDLPVFIAIEQMIASLDELTERVDETETELFLLFCFSMFSVLDEELSRFNPHLLLIRGVKIIEGTLELDLARYKVQGEMRKELNAVFEEEDRRSKELLEQKRKQRATMEEKAAGLIMSLLNPKEVTKEEVLEFVHSENLFNPSMLFNKLHWWRKNKDKPKDLPF